VAIQDYPVLSEIFPGVRRLRAPNPGVMTGRGTNSYLLGTEDLVAIDPGPDEPGHLRRLLELAGANLRYVLVTHCHADHAPGATWLAAESGATLLAYGDRPGLAPDGELRDGDLVQVEGYSLEALHTPGHSSDHLCYLLRAPDRVLPGAVLFSGDHIMGGSTVVIGPPDGDMGAYLASLERLAALQPPIAAIAPGHGEVLGDPARVLADYLEHRRQREAVVTSLLSSTPVTPGALVNTIYPELTEALQLAAARQIWAHLRKLGAEGVATSDAPDLLEGKWSLSATR
jgi:glyoxylase-like metal-dependent hydrolase (beta-lactamase superfamily II)